MCPKAVVVETGGEGATPSPPSSSSSPSLSDAAMSWTVGRTSRTIASSEALSETTTSSSKNRKAATAGNNNAQKETANRQTPRQPRPLCTRPQCFFSLQENGAISLNRDQSARVPMALSALLPCFPLPFFYPPPPPPLPPVRSVTLRYPRRRWSFRVFAPSLHCRISAGR